MNAVACDTIDMDSHIVEPRDAWSRHIEPAFRNEALAIVDVPAEVHGVHGQRPHLAIGGRHLFAVGAVVPLGLAQENERAAAPDASERPVFAAIRDILFPLEASSPPEGHDGRARLRWMDGAGIERAVICPTWGLMWEQYLTTRPAIVCANMRAYNKWLRDFCAPNPSRLVGVGELTLLDVDWAIEEAERLAHDGFRTVRLRPTLHGGKTITHPDFDRFWDVLAHHDLGLVFHIDGQGTDGDVFLDEAWYFGEERGPASGLMVGCMPHLPAMMTLTAMFRVRMFDRHPTLRLALLELGAGWLTPYLELADQVFRLARGNAGKGRAMPSEIAARQIWATPLEAESVSAIVQKSGGPPVCFGSDYPHPESSHTPIAVWTEKLGDVSDAVKAAFFRTNAARYLGGTLTPL